MKKTLALILALVTLLSLLTGCAKTAAPTQDKAQDTADTTDATEPADTAADETPADAAATDASDYKIFLIVTGGTLGDQAANDASYEGLKQFSETTGATFDYVELSEVADIETTVRTMAAEGYNMFYFNAPDGSDMMDVLCPDYPEIRFVMNNGTNNNWGNLTNTKPDVASSGFLCGIFATLMNEYLTGEKVCGYIGGVRNPNLERVRYGMQAAAELLGGTLNAAYVGNFTDAAAAKEIAQQMQSSGIHVLQAWAGGCNKGVFEAAETAGEGYYSLGAATGQFHMSDTIIASNAENRTEAIMEICKAAVNGTLEGGEYVLSVANGGIDCKFAPDERADLIPQEIKDAVEEYRQKLISGELFAPKTEEEYNDFVAQFISK